MSRASKLILVLVLLGALASCHTEEEKGSSSNASNPNTPTTINAVKLSEEQWTLISAAAQGDTKKVKEMLDKGVNVDARDLDGGVTPLGLTAWFGHMDTAKLLIERGADVNAKKNDGTTVLMLATLRNHNDIAEMLRKAGAK